MALTRWWRALLLPGLLLCLPAMAAPVLVPIPLLLARVTDLTQTLDPASEAQLEAKLRTFEIRRGSQVTVLILPTTRPETIEAYGIRLAGQWRTGRRKVDDGVILIVAKEDRTVRIEVGYGFEGVLNDATAARIIRDSVLPRFKEGQFALGIATGVDRILQVIDGEPLAAVDGTGAPLAAADGNGAAPGGAATGTTTARQIPPSAVTGGVDVLLPVGLVLALVVGGILRALFGPLPAALLTGVLAGLLVWWLAGAVLLAVLATLLGFAVILAGGTRTGFALLMLAGAGGGSGGRGSGGGGFSGGGGGFGGGGASGRW